MTCPRCHEKLRQAQRMRVEIDYCPRCRGVWLDGGEMEKLLERSRGDDIFPVDNFEQDSAPARPERSREERPERPREERPERPREERYERPREERYERPREDRYERPREERYERPREDRYEGSPRKKKKGFLGELIDLFD